MTQHLLRIKIEPNGAALHLYNERFMPGLGPADIERVSTVDSSGHTDEWYADLELIDGPQLGPFGTRSKALEEERIWIERVWMPMSQ